MKRFTIRRALTTATFVLTLLPLHAAMAQDAPPDSVGEASGEQPAAPPASPAAPTGDRAEATPAEDLPPPETAGVPVAAEEPPRTVDEDDEGAPPPEEGAPVALELGGILWTPTAEARPRLEVRIDAYDPASATDEQDLHFVTMRSRIGLSGQAGAARGFVQIQDVRDWGAVPSTGIGGGFTGVHQGYFELTGDLGWLRAGRQEVSYGKQRMIGALNWATQARAFDGLRLHGLFGDLEVDLLGAYLTSQRFLTTAAGDPVEVEGEFLVTLQVTYAVAEWLKLEPYVLYRHDDATADDPGRRRNIASPGVRVTGRVGAFDYDVEGIFQGGKVQIGGVEDQHLAFAVVTEVGYRFEAPLNPAVRVGGAYASGNDADGELDELDNFFPTNHMHYGFADLFGLRNLLWGFVRGGIAPDDAPLNLTLTAHLFGLADPAARWSDAGGATLGQDPTNEDRFLGGELDLNVVWKPLPHFALSGGYSLFLPAQGAENLGNGDPTHWMYTMAGVKL